MLRQSREILYARGQALLVVDLQNDFVDPAGSLCVSGAIGIIDVINTQLEAASDAGVTVVATQDWHPAETPHFRAQGGIWPVHCVAGTWGAEFVNGFHAPSQVVRKGVNGEDGYSGFTVRDPKTGATHSSGLQELLDAAGVRAVTVVGVATDYCVKATALDAVDAGFDVRVLRAAVAAVDLEPGDGERAFAEMEKAGVSLV
jgi:nicotinamidase/pyrazinamidase